MTLKIIPKSYTKMIDNFSNEIKILICLTFKGCPINVCTRHSSSLVIPNDMGKHLK